MNIDYWYCHFSIANFTVEEISALLNSTDGCIQIPGVDIEALMTRQVIMSTVDNRHTLSIYYIINISSCKYNVAFISDYKLGGLSPEC